MFDLICRKYVHKKIYSKIHFQKMNFMRKFGYLESSYATTSETLYHEETVIAAIKNMQKYGGLNESGVLDNATLKVSAQ